MKPGGMPGGIEEVANELGALAKRIYDTGVIDTEQRLTITYDELPVKNWNIKGDGWYGDAHLKRSSSYKFANPKENLPQDTVEQNKQFLIRNVEMFGLVPFTKDFLMKLVGGVTSFEDYTFKIEDLLRTQKKNLNQAVYIGPVMARCALTTAPAPSVNFDVDSTQYIHIGMFIDIYTAAGALQVSNVEITGIVGLTLTVSVAVTAGITDIVYLHEENVAAGTGKGLIGLPFQCDDGSFFATMFEGLDRALYPSWRGNVIDATNGPLTNDLLQKGQNEILTASGSDYMTEDYVNFVHPDSIRRYLQIVLPQKRYIDATKYDAGMSKPNMLEWNGKPIVIDPDCVKTSWFMYNRAHGGKMEIAPLAVDSMLGGTSMKWRSGYMQGVSVTYYSGNLGINKPNTCLEIVNLKAL